jgi:hypothetical protein
MANWDPPQPGARPNVPLTPVDDQVVRWWSRRYRRLPVWAWAAIGFLGVGAVGAATEDSNEGSLASGGPAATATVAPSPTTTASTIAPTSTTRPPATTLAVSTTLASPTTVASTTNPSTTSPTTTTTVPPATTTVPRATTTAAPVTTTTRPPPPPPPPPPPTTTTVAVAPFIPSQECDPNYTGCVPIASDVDCAGGSGNGPAYVQGPVTVIGSDIYDLDRDNDGIGCE